MYLVDNLLVSTGM